MAKEIGLMKKTILFLLISSLLLLCAVFVDIDSAVVKVITNIGALLCWVFLVIGYICFYQFSKRRKEKESGSGKTEKPGAVIFFSNDYAKKADITMIVSLIISVVLTVIKQVIVNSDPMFSNLLFEFVSVLSFAIFLFAAQMHCIFNGVNFRYYLSLKQ